MCNINKEINRIIKEIILLMLLIIFSSLLWSTFNYEKDSKIAYAYSNINALTIVQSKNDENTILKITNTSKVLKKYKLFLKTEKEINQIIIENKVVNLDKINNFKIGTTTYYLLDEGTIDKKTTKKITIIAPIEEINFKLEEI